MRKSVFRGPCARGTMREGLSRNDAPVRNVSAPWNGWISSDRVTGRASGFPLKFLIHRSPSAKRLTSSCDYSKSGDSVDMPIHRDFEKTKHLENIQ